MDTSRFKHGYIPEDQRICLLCQTEVESEKHVILSCPVYEDLRRELFIKAFSINSDFYEMSSDAKLCFIMSIKDIVKFTAKTLNSILNLRRKYIFKWEYPANTRHLSGICAVLGQRRRRWADVVQMLYGCFVLAG